MVRFAKWHALGNSYLVVERAGLTGPLDSDTALRLCDPQRGIGADGVLEVVRWDADAVEIVIWNPDGSTAQMSGNGTRIAAAWLMERSGGKEAMIHTGDRTVQARMRDEGTIEQELGTVVVSAEESIDVYGNPVKVIPVDVGNPHAVLPCQEPSREVLLRLGPLVETHPRFPERTNVQLAHRDGPNDVSALVWERGAGETPASGSSAVAVAAAAIESDWCRSPVTVHMPGGTLEVVIENDAVTLIGPAEEICRGELLSGAQDDFGTIAWADLTVADADRLRDFYAAVTGWEPQGLDMGGYEDWTMSAAGRPVAGICNARGPNEGLPPVWLVYITVPDLAAALEEARARGGEVTREPEPDRPYAIVRDPAGAAFALFAAPG